MDYEELFHIVWLSGSCLWNGISTLWSKCHRVATGAKREKSFDFSNLFFAYKGLFFFLFALF